LAKQRSSIITRTGDKGSTRLFSGEEVPKDSERPDAYGDVDELVSLIGIAVSLARKPAVIERLRDLQRALFIVGAELATDTTHVDSLSQRIDADDVHRMEDWCISAEARIPEPSGFILPGGTTAAAHVDYARAVARRLERRIIGLVRRDLVINEHLLVWMNRASDLLWILAREEEGEQTMLKEDAAPPHEAP
jgi:ATP:cob(I)alamin adenosyltransferase